MRLFVFQKKGYVTVSEIRGSLKWEKERACHVLVSARLLISNDSHIVHAAAQTHPSVSCSQDHLLKEGLAWLDSQAPGEAQYWLPALFSELSSRDVTPEEASQMTP